MVSCHARQLLSGIHRFFLFLREREKGKFSNRDTTRECAQLTRSIARNTMAFRPDVVKQRRSHFRAGVAQW